MREWIIDAIPHSLKLALSAGIGLFLGFIGLQQAGIVVDHPKTLVQLGNLKQWSVLLAALGFVVVVALDRRRVPGAIIIGILGVTVAAAVLKLIQFKGVVAASPSIAPTLLEMDIAGALNVGIITVVFAFLFVDLFDTAGTLIGVAHQGNMLDSQGRLPRLGRALIADSTATVAGAALGTSTTTSYIESALGIQAGGRTRLTAVTVGVLFLLCLFLAPLAGSVPPFATAPALVFVAAVMARGLAEVDWTETTECIPAAVTAIAMPLTFSIATGIGFAFITYTLIKLLSGHHRDLNWAVVFIAVLFIVKFAVV